MMKKTGLVICLLILVASLVGGCLSKKVLLPPGDATEFTVNPKGGDPTRIEFLADDGKMHDISIEGVSKHYDRSENQREYAVITMLPNSQIEEYVAFHLLESKKPLW